MNLTTRLMGDAARLMEAPGKPTVEAVHGTRVALKRARSILRMVEKAGADWALMPRLRLAALARELSAARESAVASGLVRRLQRKSRGSRRALAARLRQAVVQVSPADRGRLGVALRREVLTLQLAPAPKVTVPELAALLRRCLERVSRYHREAVLSPSRVRIHAWRKALIVLRDQTGLAAAIWPAGAGRVHPRLVRLARAMGRIGDSRLLETRIRRLAVPPPLQVARGRLLDELAAVRNVRTVKLLGAWPGLARHLERLLQ